MVPLTPRQTRSHTEGIGSVGLSRLGSLGRRSRPAAHQDHPSLLGEAAMRPACLASRFHMTLCDPADMSLTAVSVLTRGERPVQAAAR